MLLAGDSGLEFEPLPLYYDVNADDALTPHDALVVVNSLASKTSASELPSADVDRNAVIEANDARLVLEALILQTAPAAARGLVEADQATGEQRDWGAGREGLAPVMESDTPEPISPSGLAMQTLTTGTTGPSGPTGETTTTGTTGPTSPSGPTGETASTGTTGPAPPPPPGGETTGGELRYGAPICGDMAPEPWRETPRNNPAGPGSAVWTTDGVDVASSADIPWVDGTIVAYDGGIPTEDSWADDSTVGIIAILKHRQYYVALPAENQSLDNPYPDREQPTTYVETKVLERETVRSTSSGDTINLAVEAKVKNVGRSFGFQHSSEVTFTERDKKTETDERTTSYDVPACAGLTVYDVWLVTEFEYFWDYYDDTLIGDGEPPFGFTYHAGFATAKSIVWKSKGSVVEGNSVLRPVLSDGQVMFYDEARGPIYYASPHLGGRT